MGGFTRVSIWGVPGRARAQGAFVRPCPSNSWNEHTDTDGKPDAAPKFMSNGV